MQSDLIRIHAAENIQEIFQDISHLSVNKKCTKLGEILCDTNETLHFYSHKIKEQKKQIRKLKEECQQKINSVRGFWQDKIFNEHSRAGKVVKKASIMNRCR